MMDAVDRTKGSDMQPQQQPTKQIVHVRGDSETELDLLFSVLNSRDQKPPNRSFRDMNLPPSFFRPPDPKPAGYHSRENSLDGLSVANHLVPAVGARQPNMNVFHSRSHSSPAQLPLTLSVAPPAGASHLKQGSADSSGTALNTGAVPVAGIGTEDVGGNQQQQHTVWAGNPQQLINNNKYIVNPAGVWQTNAHGVVSNAGVPIAINSSSKQLPPSNPLVLTTAGQCHQQGNLGPLPAGWEQGVTADGDVYYINHNDKTTSWYDPRIPKSAQKVVPVKASSLHTTHNTHLSGARVPGTQLLSNNVPVPNANEQLIRIELQKLQKEKERLLREQEDNNRKEQALLKELTKLKSLGTVSVMPVVSQPSSVHQLVTAGVDPFLGQAAFVGGVSDQNVHDSNSQPNNLDMSAVGNEMSHATGMEIPMLGVDAAEPLAMDSDDLVSSLTVGDLGMDVQMMENIIQYI